MANTPTAAAQLAASPEQAAFDRVKKCIELFGVVGTIVLGTVAVMAATGHTATSFMWVRGTILLAASPFIHRLAILLAASPFIHRLADRASQGSAQAFDRLRTLATVMPIAVIGVDLVPGLCPAWYTVLQGLSVPALVAVAVITRSSALRTAFSKTS